MKVKDLIRLLTSEDPEADVVANDDEWACYYPIEDVSRTWMSVNGTPLRTKEAMRQKNPRKVVLLF